MSDIKNVRVITSNLIDKMRAKSGEVRPKHFKCELVKAGELHYMRLTHIESFNFVSILLNKRTFKKFAKRNISIGDIMGKSYDW